MILTAFTENHMFYMRISRENRMNQFTDSVTEALQAAFAEAQRRNQTRGH